jgi:hypothetical protein
MKVEFNNPDKRNKGEIKSKLLKSDSELYIHLTKLKEQLKLNGFDHQDRMDLHSEVLNNDKESLEIFLARVKSIEGQEINHMNPANYKVVGRAVVLILGKLEGYKYQSKITIAFFDDTIKTSGALKYIIENL